MLSKNHWDLFLSEDNFHLAYLRLQTASRTLYKELYYEDLKIFSFFLEKNISILINEIKHEIFRPESSYKVFIPKKNNLFRPLSLLKFKDLLVYQSIINTIADIVYDEIYPYYNHIIFGNVYNTSNENDKFFFFKPWKQQWRKFEDITRKFYENDYKFLADFDIASFFDTIDHYILKQILENNFQIDTKLVEFLITLLEAFTSDSHHKTFRSKHGIPQGPIASAFLADLYLFHFVDLEMIGNKNKPTLDIQYIRYVDDIRIFSKDKISAQKAIANLDLLARDLGLIPQQTKISFNEINSLDEILKNQKNKFSAITKEFKKAEGSLKSKTHRKLKQRFIDCLDKTSEEEFLDKTIINFSLYKLNKDEDIKISLLIHWELLYIHMDGLLFYLRKHFSEDKEVRSWLITILRSQNVLFHHVIALIFKFFPNIEFMEDIYKRYFIGSDRHWLVRYFMLGWLYHHKKIELILAFSSDNYFLNREANNFKFKISQEPIYLETFVQALLKDRDCLVALQGLNWLFCIETDLSKDGSEWNDYIRCIFYEDITDYIKYTLKNEFLILVPENFFNSKIWKDEKIYKQLNIFFRIFYENKDIDPSKSLMNLNCFNNLIYDKICHTLNIPKPAHDYGVNLNSKVIEENFPVTNKYLTEINDKRNQRTEAHPYDKYNNIRSEISREEMAQLVRKQKKALEEICRFNFLLHMKL